MEDLKRFKIDLNDFEISEKSIGKGSYADVFKAIRKTDRKEFALKKFHDDAIKDESQKKMFMREVSLLAKLIHPCTLGLQGYILPEEDSGENPIIMTEFMSNGDLFDMLRATKAGKNGKTINPLFDETCLMINAFGIAAGMNYVHKIGCIHRDLKPANVMLNDNFEPKIADFGLAKFSDGMQSMIGGSPYWMAPELHMGQPYDSSVDVYAYGVILYQILTKTVPFDGIYNAMQIREVICRGDRPRIPDSLDPFYADIIRKCWDQDPYKRPTFEHVVNRLMKATTFLPNTDVERYNRYRFYILGFKEEIQKPLISNNNMNTFSFNAPTLENPNLFDNPNKNQSFINYNQNGTFKYKSDNQLNIFLGNLGNDNTPPFNLSRLNSDPIIPINSAILKNQDNAYDLFNQINNNNTDIVNENVPKYGFSYKSKIPKLSNKSLKLIEHYIIYDLNDICNEGLRLIYEGNKNDKIIGMLLLRYAGQKGHSESLFECGQCLMKEDFSKKDPLKALLFFVESASKGNPKANLECANFLLNGTYIPKDFAKAIHFLKQAADQGIVEAMLKIAQLIIYKKCNITDYSIANKYLKEGAESGNVDCMYLYAYNYENGFGFDKPNIEQAIKYYQMAADLQHSDSLCNLGRLYEKIDINKAKELYRRAALTGNTLGMYNYANLLEADDKENAIIFYKMAADRGDSDACIHIYRLSNNTEDKIFYCKKGASLGDYRGEYTYGMELYRGKHIEKNEQEGIRYLKSSARKGYKRAIDFLEKNNLM